MCENSCAYCECEGACSEAFKTELFVSQADEFVIKGLDLPGFKTKGKAMHDDINLTDLEPTSLAAARQWVELYPHKRGIVSDAIRAERENAQTLSNDFIRYEAHLNMASSTPEIDAALLTIGFEADDFVELFPVEYTRNFTFSFDIPVAQDSARHRTVIKDGCRLAMDKVLATYDDWAFVEAERFPSANIHRYGEKKSNAPTLDEHGLGPLSVIDVPDELGVVNAHGHTPATHKVIDVHVKLRGLVQPSPSFTVSDRIVDPSKLAAALATVGMYRISSVSGNTIYTAQFADGFKGKRFVAALDALLLQSGLAESMIVEPCFLFLRNQRQDRFAPICPLLE